MRCTTRGAQEEHLGGGGRTNHEQSISPAGQVHHCQQYDDSLEAFVTPVHRSTTNQVSDARSAFGGDRNF